MIKEVHYVCEICGKKYNSPEDALKCESKGVPDIEDIPIGIMFPYYHHGFVGIFAVAKVTKSLDKYGSHFLNVSKWASRVPKYPIGVWGDSLGSLCGSSGDAYTTIETFRQQPLEKHHLETPEFEKMVFALRANGITPKYFDTKGNLITL